MGQNLRTSVALSEDVGSVVLLAIVSSRHVCATKTYFEAKHFIDEGDMNQTIRGRLVADWRRPFMEFLHRIPQGVDRQSMP